MEKCGVCVVCLFVPHREDGEEGGYKLRAVSSVKTYLPGRGLSVISKADGLGPAPPLHCRRGCFALSISPLWESARHNLWQRGLAFARPLSKTSKQILIKL